jgi:hypothetical protein
LTRITQQEETMKSPARIALFISVLVAVVLAACAPAAAPSYVQSAPAMTAAPASDGPLFKDSGARAAGAPAPDVNLAVQAEPAATAGPGDTTLPDGNAPQQIGRMIIKNAELKLQVADTDVSIDRTTQVVGDLGGYIISSRVWYQDANGKSYKYATLSLGVPVDQFETAMRRLRGLALQVMDENASGQDVSNQYVDLQSQLANLQATRDRIRGFLQQAKTVDEALQVNQQLTDVEGQIEKVQGQMTYLAGRSAFSTITVNLEPKLADITPTVTPTPTPTATPTAWSPGTTVTSAEGTLVSAYQGIIEMLIWLFLVVVPLLGPPALIVWLLWKLFTRKSKRPAVSE